MAFGPPPPPAFNKPAAALCLCLSLVARHMVGIYHQNIKPLHRPHGPPLSHSSGVRARQEQVPFVLVEDDAFFEESIAPLLGKHVTLSSVPDATTLTSGAADAPGLTGKASRGRPEAGAEDWKGEAPRRISKLSASAAVVPLAEAEAGSCGSKAAACSRLSRLAVDSKGNSGSEFAAPPGVVLPFGTMELALEVRYQEGGAGREALAVYSGGQVRNGTDAFGEQGLLTKNP